MTRYDAAYISEFYDDYGLREWERLEGTPADIVSFHIHRHYLNRYVKPGSRVLEAGAGPGRFTLELARLGVRVTVGDISKTQLALNERHVAEAGLAAAVEDRVLLDITDLQMFADSSFDAVVCYGGALSYVMERADDALSELLRVLKPEGLLLTSVMSLLGATRIFFDDILTLENYPDLVDGVRRDGLLTVEHNSGHPMKLYRYADLRALLERHSCEVVAASAANCLSARRDDMLVPLLGTEAWERFLEWELEFCAEAGALDCGTHILVVARKAGA